MTDDLVKRLRIGWHDDDTPIWVSDAMTEAADRIETLTAERDVSNELGKALEEDAGQLRAERDRLRVALEDIADHDTGATAGLAYTAKIALKGETP